MRRRLSYLDSYALPCRFERSIFLENAERF
jgi:hypothetical protein